MRTTHSEEGFLSSRRYFWIFVAIFSATIFCASTHLAARYCRYVETTRQISQPGDHPAAQGGVAAMPEGASGQPVRSNL